MGWTAEIVHFRFASYLMLFLHNSHRDVSLLLVVNLLKKKNTTSKIVHHVSLSRNMLQFSFFHPSVCSVLYLYVWICTKDMTTLSTLKKIVIVSPSTWTYGTNLIQANYVKLQLEKGGKFKNTTEKEKKMKHLLPHRILQLVFT